MIRVECLRSFARAGAFAWCVLSLSLAGPLARAQAFDAYRPARPGPLVIFVHGGAWLGGSKIEYKVWAEALAKRGLCVAVVDYHLAPAFKHPRPVADLEDARVRVTKSPGPNCDGTRVVLMGHSAGAHAIAFWATGNARAKVRGFVGLAGIYDLPTLVDHNPTYRDWFVTPEFGVATDWSAASPQSLDLKVKAPWLLVHASDDELVQPAQTVRFAKHLRSKKIEVETFEPPGLKHFGVVGSMIDRTSVVADRVVRFVRRVTK